MGHKKSTIEELKELNVKWIHLWITDIHGHIRNISFSVDTLSDDDLETGFGFDGSSIPGYKTIEDSDMIAKPDVSTLKVLPWTNFAHKSAIFITDIYEGFVNKRFEGDPRYVAQRTLEMVKKEGFSKVIMSPEVEFFVFDKVTSPELRLDPMTPEGIYIKLESRETSLESGYYIRLKDGYFQHPPLDKTHEFRMDFANTLLEMGIRASKTHHEVATAGQVEIIIGAADLVTTADNIQVYKYVARNIAHKHGLVATFMPKPLAHDNGSGMHVHQSLWKDNENAFYDPNDKYAELSQIARYYIGGILDHAEALTAIVAPTVNSYKRLTPGFEAPVYICWGRKNRSALIRVPLYKGGPIGRKLRRIEVRFPDPSSNPYLTLSVIVAAGLDGIKRKIDPGDPVDEDVYHLSPQNLKEYNIRQLPGTLIEAVEALESDEVLQRTLGSHIFDQFIEIKKKEWRDYLNYITPWEYLHYFNL
ncbi:MAG: type I glutamate--ammonia ligase [Candidatus Asgardarchaeia archaeon]